MNGGDKKGGEVRAEGRQKINDDGRNYVFKEGKEGEKQGRKEGSLKADVHPVL